MRFFRRSMLAAIACIGLMTVASAPAWAQVERVYTGVTPPVLGGVLGESGERPAVAAAPTQAPAQQVLPLQVSGAAAATQQAPVQSLAFTGADVASLVVLALFAIAVGTVLARRARPRNVTSS